MIYHFKSNPDQLVELQDILTFFIKYENRHCIKNTLALIDPKSCQVTQVVADNVTIDLEQEDFIESKEKVPVYVDSKVKEREKKRAKRIIFHIRKRFNFSINLETP